MQLYLKKRLLHGCFPVNFVKFLRTSFLQNPSGRLLKYKRKAMSLVLYLFNYGSSKSTFFMLNMAFDVILSTIFVKIVGILRFLPYKEYKKILLLVLKEHLWWLLLNRKTLTNDVTGLNHLVIAKFRILKYLKG